MPLCGILTHGARGAEFEYKLATGQDPTHPVNIRAAEALNRIREATGGKLDIKLVIEHDDRATRLAIEALDLPATYEIVIAPAGWPRTKPRALNIALPLVRGELLVIFDARTPLLRANCARRRNVFCAPHASLPACRRGLRSTISRIPG